MQNAEPWSTLSGTYPILRGEEKSQISGADAIIKRLRSDVSARSSEAFLYMQMYPHKLFVFQGFQCPHEANQMTTYEEADAYALESYIKSSLSPLLVWLDLSLRVRTTSSTQAVLATIN